MFTRYFSHTLLYPRSLADYFYILVTQFVAATMKSSEYFTEEHLKEAFAKYEYPNTESRPSPKNIYTLDVYHRSLHRHVSITCVSICVPDSTAIARVA